MAVAVDKHTRTSTTANNGLPVPKGCPPSSAPCNNPSLSALANNGYSYEEVAVGMDLVDDHQPKVPIWVGLNCKLVSGMGKSTTCQDLISAILPASQDPSKYVLIEKWKKMERMLDPSVKILKVWKAWGDQVGDVSFILRTVPTADGYIDKKTTRKVHRKRSSNYHQPKNASHEDDCDKEGHRDAMEQLIKLVITQGEAIQAQLKKLRQQEVQIERYEEKMHKIRSSQLGENYVVDTYLKDEAAKNLRRAKRRDKSPCKKEGTHHHHHHRRKKEAPEVAQSLPLQENDEPVPSTTLQEDPEVEDEAPEAIQEKTNLLESIFQLNLKLTQEEERLVKLGLKIRKISDKQRKAEWEEVALQEVSRELDQLKNVTNDQSKEIELNELNLTALDKLLDDKHDHIAYLTHEIQLIDEQSEMLQRKVLELATLETLAATEKECHQTVPGEDPHHPHGDHLNAPSSPYKLQQSCSSSCSTSSSSVCVQLSQKQCPPTSSDPQDNDSNSDTGISSLHSSVDESPMYVLDTLV